MTLTQSLEKLESMTTQDGLLQHESNPNIEFKKLGIWPHSTCDNARALIVLSRLNILKENLAQIYLNYLQRAKRSDGWFNNYQRKGGVFIQDNPDHLQDCYGRTIWALSEFLSSQYPEELKKQAEQLLDTSLTKIPELHYIQSLAFTIIGLSKLPNEKQTNGIKKTNQKLTKELIITYNPEELKYCIARPAQAIILAGKAEKDKKTKKAGKKVLDSLIEKHFDKDSLFLPLVNPWGDEQPIEAGTMAEACMDAYKVFLEDKYLMAAKKTIDWFEGSNTKNKNILSTDGGVYDAIKENGTINTNQGAESILAYLLAISSMNES